LSDEITIKQYVGFLSPQIWGQRAKPTPPEWPPDMFAVVSSLLNKTGAYRKVVSKNSILIDWKPGKINNRWSDEMRRIGQNWRTRYSPFKRGRRYPPEVGKWWKTIVLNGDMTLSSIEDHDEICRCLFNLLAASDEACAGIGFPEKEDIDGRPKSKSEDMFNYRAASIIIAPTTSKYGSTLCNLVHPSRARVLPKLHTPVTGLTIRSLSLHLALCPADEVKINWTNNPAWNRQDRLIGESRISGSYKNLNILLVPWPMETFPSDIEILAGNIDGAAHDPQHLFTYSPLDRKHKGLDVYKLVENLLDGSEKVVGVNGIDAVILPETAVSSREFRKLKVLAAKYNVLLICGIRDIANSKHGVNKVGIYLGSYSSTTGKRIDIINSYQSKHHRWMLDSGQIANYGLVSKLHPDFFWWEGIEISPRTLRFIAFNEWLCLCALICEDLARQEPVACAIRAIGPSLLIALLMDGPQLGNRWSSHYATVFADDPGTSVLTLTSLGMVKLSHAMRPSGVFKSSRTIASWKDRQSGLIEIDLPINEEGVILCLTNRNSTEVSADGRIDHRNENLLVLGGIHTIGVNLEGKTKKKSFPKTKRSRNLTSSSKPEKPNQVLPAEQIQDEHFSS
jgi:hypothetical protein